MGIFIGLLESVWINIILYREQLTQPTQEYWPLCKKKKQLLHEDKRLLYFAPRYVGFILLTILFLASLADGSGILSRYMDIFVNRLMHVSEYVLGFLLNIYQWCWWRYFWYYWGEINDQEAKAATNLMLLLLCNTYISTAGQLLREWSASMGNRRNFKSVKMD